MKRIFTTIVLLFSFVYSQYALGQCTGNTQSGTSCNRAPNGNAPNGTSYNYGTVLPSVDCGVFNSSSNNFGPGQFFQTPVLAGGCYSFSVCGTGSNLQLSAFQGNNTSGPFAYNTISQPSCATTNPATVNITPNFTDYTRVQVREAGCAVGGTASITVKVRQNNNLNITSSATAMCEGQTRTLTATPARVSGTLIAGSGNRGTFSGPGVTGTTFTAPTPSGNSQTFTITYTFGYCTTTQNITVYRQPTTANAGPDQTNICTNPVTMAANAPFIGTGTWTLVSGNATIANPNSPTSNVTLTSNSATLRWTISNGSTCASSSDDVVLTKVTSAPTISCPSNKTVNVVAGTCASPVNSIDATVNDPCSANPPYSFTLSGATTGTGSGNVSGTSFNAGVTTVSYSATNAQGTASCNFTVTVRDVEAPVITSCPSDMVVSNDPGHCYATVNYNVVATDNCGSPSIVVSGGLATGSQFPKGTTTVTLVAQDAALPTPNTSGTCTFDVTVNDNENPQITCPSNISINNEAGQCHAAVAYTVPVGTDNCTGVVTTRTAGFDNGADFPVGTTTVTYTATDAANTPNSASCSFTVTVNDTEDPVVTCPASESVNATSGQCGLNYTYNVSFTDNCSATISQVQGLPSGSFFSVGVHPMEFNITDASSNTVNCQFTLTVVDNQDPIFTNCPVVNAGDTIFFPTEPGVCSAIATFAVSASDNCNTNPTVTHTPAAYGNGVRYDLGSVDMVYTATDPSGNTATCEFVVTIRDEEVPFISCPANQSVTFPNCQYTLPDYMALGQIDTSDNCTPVLSMVQSPAAGTVITAETTIQATATDASGNESTCAFTITPLDNTPPTISGCPAPGEKDSINVNSSCQFLIPDYALLLTPADDCNPNPTVTQSPPAGTTSATPLSVTVSVSDGSNTTTCTFEAVPKDTIVPGITCPSDRTEIVDASCDFALPDYTTLPAVTTSDNCGGTPTRSQSPAVASTISGTTTVTLYAEDASGNVGSCSFEVTLQDNIDPTITCPASHDVYVNANCLYSVEALTGLATTGDNCAGTVSVTQVPSVGTSVSGTPNLELTATDVAGNTSTCSIALNLIDTIAPNVGCPQNQTVNVDGNCEYTMGSFTNLATATDACSAVTFSQSPAAGSATFNFATDPTVNVTIYATDADANVDSCSFQVILKDVTPPSITCGGNISGVVFDGNCETQLGNRTGNVTAVSDACGGTPTVTQSPSASTVIQGQTTVTLTATDASGNTATCTFEVIPSDAQSPVVTQCPQVPVTVSADANCNYTLGDYTGMASFTDNCDQNLTKTQLPGAGTVVTTGTGTSVVVTATDDAGNQTTCTITVNPVDDTPPSITCPANQLEDFNTNCQFALIDYTGMATTSDNCATTVTVTQSPALPQTITGITLITLTASDGLNTSTCTFHVIPNDNTPPTIACPANQDVPFNSNCQYNVLNYTGMATGISDNCGTNPGDVVVTQSLTTGTAIGDTVTITLTATDPAGNTATCTFDVNPSDNTAPSITCPQNQTVAVDGSCEYGIIDYTAQAVATDVCDANVTVSQSPASASGINMATVTTVTLTATDDAGNTNTCTFTVTGEDNLPPSITCPTDTVVAGNANCQFVLLDETSNHELVLVDNCGGTPTVTQSPAAGTTILGTAVVTLTAEDSNGNTASCTFNYTVSDQTDPTIVCPADMEVSSNQACDYVVPDFSTAGNVDDNCDANPIVTQDPAINQIFVDDTLVTLTVTDASGNFATCTFTISESSNDLPNITCPGDQVVDFDGGACQATLADYTSMAVATDNCGTPTVTQSPAATTVISGTTTVTLTATDASLNTVDCTFEVTPEDGEAPTVTCLQPSITPVTGSNCTFTVGDYTGSAFVSATDNCTGTLITTQSPVAGSLIGTATVITISTTDAAGNIGTCTMTVTPQDQSEPTLFCPADVTVSLDANCEFDVPDYTSLVFVSDNCDAGPYTIDQLPASGATITGEDATTVSFSVTDGNNNVGTCSFVVTTEDNTAPTITCPADEVVSANANCEFTLADYTSSVTVDDNCTTSPTLVQTPTALVDYSGNVTVTIEATDAAGNSNSCTFNVAAEDDTKPNLTCPADQTVNFTSNCEFTLVDYTAMAVASDYCDNAPFVSQSPGIGTIISDTTTVTITALDNAGNDSICTFQVNPVDIEAPTVTCPADFTVSADANCNYDIVDYRSMVSAIDNCADPVSLDQNPLSGSLFGDGASAVISIIATDDNGNTANCAFTITVEDDTDPVLASCPTNQTVNLNANCQFSVPSYLGAPLTATDACGGSVTLAQSPVAGSLIGGNTTVSITATDANGNTDVCTFNLTTQDVTDPSILACPADISVANDATICGAVISYPTVTAIDNCDGVVVPQLTPGMGQPSGTVYPVGVTHVQYEATDNAGNSSFCDFTVTVTDTEDPVIVCPADITDNALAGTCGAVVNYHLPTVSDNCNYGLDSTLTAGLYPGNTFSVGTTLVSWEANDAAGNTSTCSFNVTVLDAEPPVITCPADMVVSNDVGLCSAVATYSLPIVTDNCTSGIVPTLTSGLASGGTFAFGVNTISYEAEDASGNTGDCSFTITVEDNEPPVLTCPNDTLINCDATVVYDLPTVTDNCNNAIVPVQTGPASGFTFPYGTTTVTFSGDDGNGNSATCSFDVTVIDTVAPAITCPADQLESFDALCELAAPDYTGLATTSDQCDGAPVVTQSPAVGATINGSEVITLTATDFAGNSSTCTFEVIDDTPPVVNCPGNQTVGSDINCQFTLLDYTDLVTTTDNCGASALAQLPAAGNVVSANTTIEITATDDFGNTSTCQFDIVLEDNIDPSITCLGNQVGVFDANCEYQLPDYASLAFADDNCDANPTITQFPAVGDMVQGDTLITLTATDADGNSTSCSFSLAPSDNIAPVITCPGSQQAVFDATCSFVMADYTGLGSVTDNCSSTFTVTQSPAVGTSHTANTIVTLLAEDEAGNTHNCVFVVVPEDQTVPTISCPADAEVAVNANCAFILTDQTVGATTLDNCSNSITVTQSPSIGSTHNSATVITLTANDGNGNTADCSFTLTPADNTPPTVTCATDIDVDFDQNCGFAIGDYSGMITATDNCGGVITYAQSPAAGTVVTGTSTVTLTATDANGNVASCSFGVTPSDATPPVVVCPTDQQVNLNAACGFEIPDYVAMATITDNCQLAATTQSVAEGTVITYATNITITATDNAGNSESCSFNVLPSDVTDPVISCPADKLVNLDNGCAFNVGDYFTEVQIADNCLNTVFSQSPAFGTVITAQTTVVMSVEDDAGNTASCSFELIPQDNTLPTITCPQDSVVSLDNNCQYELVDYRSLAVAEDNCALTALVFGQFPPSGTIIVGNTTVNITVEDGNGNQADCSFELVVEDTVAPVISVCPPAYVVSVTSNCETTVPDFSSQLTATDNCSGTVSISQIPAAGSSFIGAGSGEVTMIATDAAGNTAECQFTATVTDDVDPTITCPSNQEVTLGANCSFVLDDYTSLATGSDACGLVTISQSPVAGTVITAQLNTTLIVEDEAGNTATCTFFVTPQAMQVSVTGTDATCNSGSNGSATVSVTGGTPPYSYDWGGFDPQALAAGTYTVVVTDASGCSASGSVTIGDGPLFELELTPSGTVYVCEGESVQLNAGSGYAVYQWSTGASVASISVSNEASYWVRVADGNGCWSNTDTATVVFYDELSPQVNQLPNGLLECSNDSSSFYQWYFNGSPISGATNVTYCPAVSGNYVVSIIDANGCEVESSFAEITVSPDAPCLVGIEELGLSLDVYPNPSTGTFTVVYDLAYEMDMELAVFDLVGNRVSNNQLFSSQSGLTTIDLSDQAEGVYLLRIMLGNEKMFQQRLVIVR